MACHGRFRDGGARISPASGVAICSNTVLRMFELQHFVLGCFMPAAHSPQVPAEQQGALYSRLRWQIFLGIFIGYAGYYLIRKNFSLAVPYLVEQGFSRGDLGFAM